MDIEKEDMRYLHYEGPPGESSRAAAKFPGVFTRVHHGMLIPGKTPGKLRIIDGNRTSNRTTAAAAR